MSPPFTMPWSTGRNPLTALFAVDDFDDNRQIRGKTQNIRGVDAARMAKPHRTAQHGRPGQPLLTRFQNNRFVERMVVEAIVFSDKDAQQ